MTKETPLFDKHGNLGAKMAPFAGYYMPISYTGIRQEHFAVREKAGIFDVSHMGEFIIRGSEARKLIQYITTNDVSKLAKGMAQYNCLPNERGGIVDDLLVYKLDNRNCNAGEEAFMLVVNASNMEKDFAWITEHNKFDTRVIDISDETALLAVQGPLATEILQGLTSHDLDAVPFYRFIRGSMAGIDNVIISATGYTGSGGFELYVKNTHAAQLWDAIMEAGRHHGLEPAGLGARDTLRLEKGYCLYGNDLSDETTPLEAGLGWITKLQKGDFIGRDVLVKQKEEGLQRRLTAFVMDGRRVPRQGYHVVDQHGEIVGEVTSGTMSPTLEKPIGLAYIKTGLQQPGTPIGINIRGNAEYASIVKLPFV